MSLSELQEVVKDREAGVLPSLGSQRVRHNLTTEQQQSHKRQVEGCPRYSRKQKSDPCWVAVPPDTAPYRLLPTCPTPAQICQAAPRSFLVSEQ